MCGILGAISRKDAPAPRETVARLVPVLDHRGPDDRGSAVVGAACFGHTRLAIIATYRVEARQPVAGGGCLLTYNGEIYNFRDLATELHEQGIACTGASDTEALFLCLRHWGIERTLSALDGMFAFAFHDGVNRVTYLARDRIGEKPLYWSLTKDRLWFASEIKVLLASGEVASAPNLARVDDFLFTAKVNGAATMFRDVHELEPGTLLELKQGSATPCVRSYWRLEEEVPGVPASVDESLRQSFLANISRAVASRRISDVPVGILLSGGIDSNSLTELLLAEAPDDSLDLFFADNAHAVVSERADVEVFLTSARKRYPQANLRFHPSVIAYDDYQERFRRLTWHYDEPIQFTNTPLLGGLCEGARRAGIKVLLSGEGSDELLYGYERFERTRASLEGASDRKTILSALYFGGGLHTADLVHWLTAGVSEGAEATEPWIWLDGHLDRMPLDQLQLIFSQKFRLQMLLQRQDRIGMSEGIEIRVPFLTPCLVTWINSLPLEMKRHPKTRATKRILREAMRNRLPKRILEKPKDGFTADMNLWLREGPMASLTRELVQDRSGFCQTYLDGALARQIVDDHFAGRARRDVLVWNLFSLETWHRVYARGYDSS